MLPNCRFGNSPTPAGRRIKGLAGGAAAVRACRCYRWMCSVTAMQLHDAQGKRLYLTADERAAFLAAAAHSTRPVRTLCGVLHTTDHGDDPLQKLIQDRKAI